MQLELALHDDHIEVIYVNTSASELRVWRLGNSYGWWSIYFQIKEQQDAHISTIMHLWNVDFNKNGPETFAIDPAEKCGVSINLNDGYWMRDQTLTRLENKPLYIRVCYHVDPLDPEVIAEWADLGLSALARESSKQLASHMANVFTGTVTSDWVKAEPPHGWLFGQPPYRFLMAEELRQYPSEDVLSRLSGLVGYMIWSIKYNAERVNQDSVAPSIEIPEMHPGTTVGHLMNCIVADAEQIRKAIAEVNAYREAQRSPKTGDKPESKG